MKVGNFLKSCAGWLLNRPKQLIGLAVIAAMVSLLLVVWANRQIEKQAQGHIFTHTDSIPAGQVALLLGTSPYLRDGRQNLYFNYRIEAAVDLFNAGKTKLFVVSGDNGRKDYNEPEAMRLALMQAGVPDSCIFLDYAGFRTFDSVYRMRAIFGQDAFVVVSQPFHNERAVYIGRRLGMQVVAFNARDVNQFAGFKTQMREKLARLKVYIDFLIGAKPRFLGEKVPLPTNQWP